MILKYLNERRSWILLFIAQQLLILFVAYVDTTIPFQSILYLIILSLVIFIGFVIIRFSKETQFYRALEERDSDFDLTTLPAANSPFERIIEESMTNQTELLKKKASDNLMTLEQEKDDLLAWIHEVKTPLTAMRLMIDRLEDDTARPLLTYEWLRIHLLLDQQLHQRRIPFMENDLYVEQTDLETLLFDEIKTLQAWCIQKGIGIDMDLQVTEVLSDAKWLAFILRQLLTNAVKYSQSSDIQIRSYIHNQHVHLEVKDYGRGIDARDLPRIFDKGFTSTTTHQDHAATGMGLYLSQKAAQALLIQIQVESTVGEGTIFTLTLPERNDFVKITSV